MRIVHNDPEWLALEPLKTAGYFGYTFQDRFCGGKIDSIQRHYRQRRERIVYIEHATQLQVEPCPINIKRRAIAVDIQFARPQLAAVHPVEQLLLRTKGSKEMGFCIIGIENMQVLRG